MHLESGLSSQSPSGLFAHAQLTLTEASVMQTRSDQHGDTFSICAS